MQIEVKRAFNDSGQRIQKHLNSTHNVIKHLREIVRENIKSKLIVVGGSGGESLLGLWAVALAYHPKAEHAWRLASVLFPEARQAQRGSVKRLICFAQFKPSIFNSHVSDLGINGCNAKQTNIKFADLRRRESGEIETQKWPAST